MRYICYNQDTNRKDNMSTYKTISEIPPDYQLITDSQDIKAIAEGIGLDDIDYYGCLFVTIQNGDYKSIYGCEHSVPMLQYKVDKLI